MGFLQREAVAKEDSVALLDWYTARVRGFIDSEWDRQYIVRAAASFGSRAILQMAILERKWKQCSEEVCAGAAAGGYLEVLKWARENDCPWDKETCKWAAENGHLEILKWAREQGCPWSERTRNLAAERLGYVE